jgi:hypothetical protein
MLVDAKLTSSHFFYGKFVTAINLNLLHESHLLLTIDLKQLSALFNNPYLSHFCHCCFNEWLLQ